VPGCRVTLSSGMLAAGFRVSVSQPAAVVLQRVPIFFFWRTDETSPFKISASSRSTLRVCSSYSRLHILAAAEPYRTRHMLIFLPPVLAVAVTMRCCHSRRLCLARLFSFGCSFSFIFKSSQADTLAKCVWAMIASRGLSVSTLQAGWRIRLKVDLQTLRNALLLLCGRLV
jgi:hypothetical protein